MLFFGHQLTSMDYLIGAPVFCVAVFLLGAVGQAVLRENGFGTVLNGLLLLAGMVAGVLTRGATIGFQ